MNDNLRALQDKGWVEEDQNRKYESTELGDVAIDGLRDYRTLMETANELKPFLTRMPVDDIGLELRWLTDGKLTLPEPALPQGPMQAFVSHLEAADEFRAVMPVVTPSDSFRKGFTERESEVVVNTTVLEALETKHVQTYRHLVDRGSSVYVYDEPLPFGLALADDTVLLQSLTDDDIPHSLVETRNQRCRDWAEQVYSEYRDEATPLSEFEDRNQTSV